FAQGDLAETQTVLEQLRAANPNINSPEGHMIYTRSLELQGKTEQALREYAALITYYPGQEARCRYARLLAENGRAAEARRLFEEVCRRSTTARATSGASSGRGTT
ncbi:MAG TPA: tetratricopeptide repeat protein, partial [Stellaceae bacterium]|nr:tetratricopeptide repeat protein [Stellaceae bacterium]